MNRGELTLSRTHEFTFAVHCISEIVPHFSKSIRKLLIYDGVSLIELGDKTLKFQGGTETRAGHTQTQYVFSLSGYAGSRVGGFVR